MKKVFSFILSGAIALSFPVQPFAAALPSAVAKEDVQYGTMTGFTFQERPTALINNNADAYNYGTHIGEDGNYMLDENNRLVYAAFAELIAPSTDPITITLASPVSFNVTTLIQSSFTNADTTAFNDAIITACQSGLDAALFDIPELFWIDPGRTSIGIKYSSSRIRSGSDSGKYKITISAITITPGFMEVYGDLEGVNAYRDRLEAAVNDFIPEDNELSLYNKLMYVHDAIACHTSYDYDYDSAFDSSAIGSLVEDKVVCEGYSEGFKLICDRMDIPCVCVFGDFDESENIGHMWNYVQMDDGKWYGVDVTWDDLDGEYGQQVRYKYFLKGSSSFAPDHTEMDYGTTVFDYPDLAYDDYDPENVVTTTTTTTTTTTSTTTTTTEETSTSTSTTTTEETTTSTSTTTSTTTSETTTTSTTTSTTSTTTSTTSTTTSTTTTSTATTTTTETTTSTTTAPPEPDYSGGDVNQDGETNIADLVSLISGLLGRDGGSPVDINSSGRCDVFDVIFLRRILFLPPKK